MAIADRSGGQAWPSIQIRCRKSTSDRIETKTTTRIAQYVIQYTEPHPIKRTEPMSYRAERELKMKALKKQTKIRHIHVWCGNVGIVLGIGNTVHSVLRFYI